MAEIIHLLTGLGDDIQKIHHKHQKIINILNSHYKQGANAIKTKKPKNNNEYIPSYMKDIEQQQVRAHMEKQQIKKNRRTGGNYDIAGNEDIAGDDDIAGNYIVAGNNKRGSKIGQRKIRGSGIGDLLNIL